MNTEIFLERVQLLEWRLKCMAEWEIPNNWSGTFVDNEVGAATATGHGEEVIRTCGSHLVVELMRQGKSPQEACEEAVKRIYKNFVNQNRNVKTLRLVLSPSTNLVKQERFVCKRVQLRGSYSKTNVLMDAKKFNLEF